MRFKGEDSTFSMIVQPRCPKVIILEVTTIESFLNFSGIFFSLQSDISRLKEKNLMIVNSLTGNYYFQSYNGLKFF